MDGRIGKYYKVRWLFSYICAAYWVYPLIMFYKIPENHKAERLWDTRFIPLSLHTSGVLKPGQEVWLKKYPVGTLEATICAQLINFLVNSTINVSSQFLLDWPEN